MAQAAEPVYRCTICHAVYTAGERFCPLDAGAISPDGDTDPRVGRTIDGRYFVRRLIGRGGMGAVYEADHVGLDKRIAIKFLAINKTDRDALARFRREAKIASRIVHEHVVQIFDVGTADADTDFIVMELIDGQDLAAVLREARMLDPGRTVAIARQVVSGLCAIHEAGIVHRDIKPANILLATRAGRSKRDRDFVKIMDFGISRPIHGGTITNTGAIIGTPEYMAPEQLLADNIDQRADLYAVGVMMFRMLTGKLPFTDDVFDRSAAANPYVEVPAVDAVRPDVPRELAAAIAKAVAKNAGDRYADAQTFLTVLEGLGGMSAAASSATLDLGPSRSTGSVSGTERTVSAIGSEPTVNAIGTERTVSALEAGPTAMAGSEHEARSGITAPAKHTDRTAQPAVTIPEPRRRSRAPMLAALGLLIAGAAVAVVVITTRGDGRTAPPEPPAPPTAPAPAGGPDPSASPSATSRADKRLQEARAAEHAGKLEDALQAYTDAYAIEPAADTIFQIGELHERLGHTADAIAAFQRYLHVAKNASDHDVVMARIAKLEKDAKAATAPPAPPTRHPAVAEELEQCHCIPTNGPDTQSLCAKKGPSLCMCRHERGVKLCPTQVTRCAACPDPDQRCEAKGCTEAGFECSDKKYEAFHIPGTHGTRCTGYEDYRLGPELEGALFCDVCPVIATPRQFRGHHGDKCVGYYRHTGQKMEGRLWCRD